MRSTILKRSAFGPTSATVPALSDPSNMETAAAGIALSQPRVPYADPDRIYADEDLMLTQFRYRYCCDVKDIRATESVNHRNFHVFFGIDGFISILVRELILLFTLYIPRPLLVLLGGLDLSTKCAS